MRSQAKTTESTSTLTEAATLDDLVRQEPMVVVHRDVWRLEVPFDAICGYGQVGFVHKVASEWGRERPSASLRLFGLHINEGFKVRQRAAGVVNS